MSELDHTMLYDQQCPFCVASAALLVAWDRDRRLRAVDVREEEAVRLLEACSDEQRLATWHLVGPSGETWHGGLASAPALRLLPGGTPLAKLAERFPRFTERAYELISEHRSKLAPLLPDPLRRRARATLRRRRELHRGPAVTA